MDASGTKSRWRLGRTAVVGDAITDPHRLNLAELVAPGVAAVRSFWQPFLLLQSCALSLVILYFVSPGAQAFCRRFSHWHDAGGLLFSAAAAAIAGGLLPEVAKWLLPARPGTLVDEMAARQTRRWNDVAFAFAAFAVNGIITDLQFRGMGMVFGYDGTFFTSVKKVLADQFVTTPVYGITYWAVVYRWRAVGYSVPRLAREISLRWYLEQVGPLIVPCWCFWIPMDLMVYSMPAALQFELFCLALAAWSLLMVFIATRVEAVTPAICQNAGRS